LCDNVSNSTLDLQELAEIVKAKKAAQAKVQKPEK
jgi:hypothetical protein